MTKDSAIKAACREYNYRWPEDLWTGVMFYYGFRITIEEFSAVAKLFR